MSVFKSLATAVSVSNVFNLLDFLEDVDAHSKLYADPAVLANALRRYETLWLPLLKATSSRQHASLAPPLDVHWVWLVHMLSPQRYHSDMREHYGTVFDHSLQSRSRLRKLRSQTSATWTSRYPRELFNVIDGTDTPTIEYTSKMSYDIRRACERQAMFLYQVSTPQYRRRDFISHAIERYRQFMGVSKSGGNVVLVPPYDIDLVWHTHMAHPISYWKKYKVPHDDSMNDRSADSALMNNWAGTRQAWSRAYPKVAIEKFGCMWRGDLTAAESVVSSRIQAIVDTRGSESSRKWFHVKHEGDGNDLSSRSLSPTYRTVTWLHRRAEVEPDITEADNYASGYLRRVSSLRDASNDTLYSAVTTVSATSSDAHLSIEVFSNNRNSGSIDFPIATAYSAPPKSFVLPYILQRSSRKRYHTLVLRMGGSDVGFILGSWQGFHLPDPRVVQRVGESTKIENGSPGMVHLFWMPLDGSLKQELTLGASWEEAQFKSDHRSKPRTYKFNDNMVDVRAGKVGTKDALFGYLAALGAGALHVLLQPRYETVSPENSMYPACCEGQAQYELMRAVGGETFVKGQRKGLGQLLFEQMGQEVFVGNSDQIGAIKKNPATGMAGCGACGGCVHCGGQGDCMQCGTYDGTPLDGGTLATMGVMGLAGF